MWVLEAEGRGWHSPTPPPHPSSCGREKGYFLLCWSVWRTCCPEMAFAQDIKGQRQANTSVASLARGHAAVRIGELLQPQLWGTMPAGGLASICGWLWTQPPRKTGFIRTGPFPPPVSAAAKIIVAHAWALGASPGTKTSALVIFFNPHNNPPRSRPLPGPLSGAKSRPRPQWVSRDPQLLPRWAAHRSQRTGARNMEGGMLLSCGWNTPAQSWWFKTTQIDHRTCQGLNLLTWVSLGSNQGVGRLAPPGHSGEDSSLQLKGCLSSWLVALPPSARAGRQVMASSCLIALSLSATSLCQVCGSGWLFWAHPDNPE